MTGSYIQMVLALVFVVFLIIATGFVMRKKQVRSGFMSIVGYHPFGPKKGVAALRVGKEILILGVTPSEMRLLKTFKEGELDIPENEGFQNKLERLKLRIKADDK